MQAWRHDIHRHPELAFEEQRTADKVARLLTEFGLEVHTGIGNTGVVGVLRKGNSPRSIGLRADMDALKIHEQNEFDHRSINDGKMHACGHDGHTAMLLGAAQYLSKHGDFDGSVVFIFQPAEEHGEGARAMLADGLFERFPVDSVYAIHNFPSTRNRQVRRARRFHHGSGRQLRNHYQRGWPSRGDATSRQGRYRYRRGDRQRDADAGVTLARSTRQRGGLLHRIYYQRYRSTWCQAR